MNAVGTIPSRLKQGIIDALTPLFSIPVVDGTRREDTPDPPAIVVQIMSADSYSESLRDIQRIKVEVTLGVHYGDDEPGQIAEWIDALEFALADGNSMGELATNGIRIFDWKFTGAIEAWAEQVHMTSFAIEVIATRFLTHSTD
jgi:hypothetical protein